MIHHFDGETYEPEHDQVRLNSQLQRVLDAVSDGAWYTLAALKAKAGPGSEAAMSARLRDLRKARFGGLNIERRRIEGGLFEYRLNVNKTE